MLVRTVVFLLVCCAAAAPQDVLPGQLVGKLRPGVAPETARSAAGAAVAAVERALPAPRGIDRVGMARVVRVRCASGAEQQALDACAASGEFEWLERASAGPGLAAPLPNDPFVSLQYHVQQANDIDMDLPEAWQLRGTFQAAPLLVAIIDSGFPIDTTVPDLQGMAWNNPAEAPVANGIDEDGNGLVDDLHGYDFVVGEGNPDGGHPHGFWMAGLLAARTNNASDIAGVAPGVTLMHLRSFADDGDFPTSGPFAGKLAAAAAIVYATDHGARLVNNSWIDGTGPTQVILDAVQYAWDNGVLMVMSSGNDGLTTSWPSQIDNAFAVAGLDSSGHMSTFSNHGPWVDISAAATDVLLLDPSGGLFLGSGTSAASPQVTGTAALLLSEDATIPMLDLRRLLQLGAVSMDALNPGLQGQLGAGFVNAHRSLLLLEPVTNLGFGLPGNTTPGLHAYGGTQAGQTFAISIHDGPPNGVAGLVIGTSAVMLPLFGGTLVPSVGSLVAVPLDGKGRSHVEFPLPVTLPPGVPVAWMQALMKNSPAPGDVAMTNALKLQAP
jgi:hypothetical protein